MQGSGVSGDVRVVRGVPLRLRQNRDDTSWAEAYTVRATTPLSALGVKPQVYDGPWEEIGVVRPEPLGSATWGVTFRDGLDTNPPETGYSFNDALGVLAERWRDHWAERPAEAGQSAGRVY